MRVIGYLRVSSVVQRDKGNSIKMQLKKIEEYCSLNDFQLVDVFRDEGISGMSIDKRDGYKSMLSFIEENDVEGIVVWSLSRLGRRLRDVIDFMDVLKHQNIKFYSVKEGLSNDDNVGGLIMNILGSINEFEVGVIRERIIAVKRDKKERGEVYGRLVYGYDNNGGKMEVNPFEMSVVRRIKNLRSRGYSWNKISNRLNDDGIVTKDGNKWYMSSVYNMMKFYTKSVV